MKIRLWKVATTDKAIQVSNCPPEREGTKAWIPRSQIEHISWEKEIPGRWREGEFTIPDWLAEKKELI